MNHFIKKIQPLIPILFFILLFLAGWVLHDDYGGFTDEIIEIRTAAINAKYILTKVSPTLPLESLEVPTVGTLDQVEDLPIYEDRIYGTAAMLPTVLIALIPGVHFDTASFLDFRRFYTFLQFFLALIAFYLLLQARFDSIFTAMAGTLMLTLTPRFFAESFYNCKDMVFFSWFLISLCGTGLYLIRRSKWGLALFALGFALAANTRAAGIVLLPAFLFACFFTLRKEPGMKKYIPVFITILIALALFFVVTPFLWEAPLENIQVIIRFSSDELTEREITILTETGLPPLGEAELFMGREVAPKQVWYYLPVWMGITIPVLYLIFLFIEAGWIIITIVKNLRHSANIDMPFSKVFFDLFCLLLLTGGLAGLILAKVNLYHGWRHAYFLYAPLIYLAAAGFGNLLEVPCASKRFGQAKNLFLSVILGISFIVTGLWMLRNHPLDFVYFNEIGRGSAQQFARDYWGVASKRCVLDLLKEYDGRRIQLGLNADMTWGSTEFSLMRLPLEQQKKFDPVWQTKYAEYLCFSYKNTAGNDHPIADFEIIKTYQVDGYDVAGIYKRVRNFNY